MSEKDTYRKLEYRNLIAWSARLEREWPFLEKQLRPAPERSVVDLGCGPGEHVARLAEEGWRALGIDRSAGQIESAREHHPRVEFLQGSMEELAQLTEASFGVALCLGNALPSLTDEQLEEMLAGLASRLPEGGIFLAQLLDYSQILAGTKRALPVTVRPGPDGSETVFLRVYAPDDDPRFVQFVPATLRLTGDGDTPLELITANRVRHRGWTAESLEERLRQNGFPEIQRFGGLDGSAHEPGTSQDLVLVARRGGVGPQPKAISAGED